MGMLAQAVAAALPLNSLPRNNGVSSPFMLQHSKPTICFPYPKKHFRISCDSATTSSGSSATTSSTSYGGSESVLELKEIKERCKKWMWKGQYSINYFVSDSKHSPGPPLLLVHGFGASIPHWRRFPRMIRFILRLTYYVDKLGEICLRYKVAWDDSKEGFELEANRLASRRLEGFELKANHLARRLEGFELRNINTLAQNHTVYAIDLLGFGASDKPQGFPYTMEAWAQLILDFLNEIVQKPTVLIGNSVGSLACVIAASDFLQQETSQTLVCGLVLLNCAGGMNNKAIVDDWRIKLLLPLLWLIDFLLKQRAIASSIFERVKQRDTLKNILLSVYGNKESVDEDLVEIIRGPANEEGALDAFVSIVTGPPGPNPVTLMPGISIPVLVLWGDQDPFTPIDGPVGRYFSSLPSQLSNVRLQMLEGVGHCPHDDKPELVHQNLLPWLANLAT
ncbi:hypothetical protein Tsubulata_014052 [Turnera subulata]|uniref:AB hydrolase-1 domain-containing protein n=1 Tax=Turnera subulata TaxID=218843 RepID=A0A9Q0JQ60_9ROSI|nr:hypothetical protein Tsubulata_014052 [Turnera subulata]